MDAETDLFVQAFWVKCRETIRPEIDTAVDKLREAGHVAHVSTLEFSPDATKAPEGAPALVLTVHPLGSPEAGTLRYRGDVPGGDVEVTASGARPTRHELAAIYEKLVNGQISACFGTLFMSR
jgi:hypothetical protein